MYISFLTTYLIVLLSPGYLLRNGNRNKSYSRKRVYGGNNSNMNKNRNERGTTSNSIDGNPVSSNKKVVMALSSGYVGSGEEYKKHKEYINFQGGDD